MEITANNIMLLTAALLSMSVLLGKAGARFGVPALVLFLAVGMLAGVDGFGIRFDSDGTVRLIGMISLSVILFTGGAGTSLRDIRPVWRQGVTLATVGVLITTVVTGLFIHLLFNALAPEYGFGYLDSFLLAAIMSSTDSASVFSILSASRSDLKENLKPVLELESGSNDPMAYLMVIILISIIEKGGAVTASVIGSAMATLGVQLVVGALGGLVVGWISVRVINRLHVDNEFLYPVMMLACVFFAFSLTELAGGNAYLAVYVAGVVTGNSRLALKRTINTFFGGFTWLVQIIMFLSLGLLVNPHELLSSNVIVPGVVLGLFMIVVGRPVAVFLSLLPFRRFSLRARLYVSWVGLRGAVPIIFATYALASPDVLHARLMFNMVFFITLLSLLVQGTSVNPMARWLGLSQPVEEPKFNVDFPDELAATTTELTVDASLLADGDTLREVTLPHGAFVVLVRREDRFIVPTGSTRLLPADTLLILTEQA